MRRRAARSVAATLLVAAIGWTSPVTSARAQTDDRPPNVLLVVTDDQRWDTLWAMPAVQEHLVDRGVEFDNAFVVNPLCCPSRASILTGNYSHTTGVYRQAPPFGRFDSFDDSSTIATWLHDAGYETAYVGKYLDGYQHAALTGYVPPGWDHWVAFVHAGYFDYKLTVDGVVRSFGDDVADYSTRVLGDTAARFVTSATDPFFLVFAPAAPHAPATPEAQHADAFGELEPWRPPSFDEADVGDKPTHVQGLPRLSAESVAAIDELRRDQYRSLLSVDEQIDRLVRGLADSGRLDDTLVILTSDNGLAWGEHRWDKKETPYEESIRVPLVIRYDRATRSPGVEDRLALNIDLAPTIAAAASIAAPTMDGRSLLPLLAGDDPPWRTAFLVEHMEGTNPIPTYCAVRTAGTKYVRYATGEEELYDLDADPFELENVVGDPAWSRREDEMRARLRALCVPHPPGLSGSPSARIGLAVLLLVVLLGAEAWRSSRVGGRPSSRRGRGRAR